MKRLLKSIEQALTRTKDAVKHLTLLKRSTTAKSKAPKTRGLKQPPQQVMGGGKKMEDQVVQILIQLLKIHQINATVGPSSIYADPPIGFLADEMRSYLQDCNDRFQCDVDGQSAKISIRGLAKLIIKRGGRP